MAFRGVCVLLGVLLLVDCSFQQSQTRRRTTKKDADKNKDAAIEQMQKQIDNIVLELNLLKERQALQTICLKGMKIHGKCYLAEPIKKGYHAASEDCNNLGGILGVPTSSDENQQLGDYLRQSIGPDAQVWLGVNDMVKEGSWVDQTGLTISFKNWDSFGSLSQPDGGKAQNCVVLSGAAGGKWLDEACREERPSVCQFNIV